MEIEQTAGSLGTNAHANYPIAENAAYQCMENGRVKHAQDGFLENMLNVFSVLLVTRTLSNGTINGGN